MKRNITIWLLGLLAIVINIYPAASCTFLENQKKNITNLLKNDEQLYKAYIQPLQSQLAILKQQKQALTASTPLQQEQRAIQKAQQEHYALQIKRLQHEITKPTIPAQKITQAKQDLIKNQTQLKKIQTQSLIPLEKKDLKAERLKDLENQIATLQITLNNKNEIINQAKTYYTKVLASLDKNIATCTKQPAITKKPFITTAQFTTAAGQEIPINVVLWIVEPVISTSLPDNIITELKNNLQYYLVNTTNDGAFKIPMKIWFNQLVDSENYQTTYFGTGPGSLTLTDQNNGPIPSQTNYINLVSSCMESDIGPFSTIAIYQKDNILIIANTNNSLGSEYRTVYIYDLEKIWNNRGAFFAGSFAPSQFTLGLYITFAVDSQNLDVKVSVAGPDFGSLQSPASSPMAAWWLKNCTQSMVNTGGLTITTSKPPQTPWLTSVNPCDEKQQ